MYVCNGLLAFFLAALGMRNLGADYMRRAGPVSRAGSVCRDLGTSVKHVKNQLCDYRGKISARLAGLKIYHVIAIARPARLAGPTLHYMSRAGSVSSAGSVYRDDGSARYYIRRASPSAAKFRSCRVKRWLHQRAWIEWFYFPLSIILVYYFQFYVALWSGKPLCVI